MNEHGYIRSVHRQLKNLTHDVAMVALGHGGGVPDRWYDGPDGDCWVEYKYIQQFPRLYKPALTRQQILWLSRRHANGRTVLVITGSPKGSLIQEDTRWELPFTIHQFIDLQSTKEVAEFIWNITGGTPVEN